MITSLTLSLILNSILFFAVSNATASCKDGDFMKDPNSCDHFYKCDHGKPVKFACGPGTWFNEANNNCDWPYNVKCDVNTGGQGGGSGSSQAGNSNVKPGGQQGGGSGSSQTGNSNSYNGGSSNNDGNTSGDSSSNNQGQNQSPQNPGDEGYLWPIQTPSGSENNNGGSGQNGEDRPRPTIDDLYNGNNNPYQEYLGNNHF